MESEKNKTNAQPVNNNSDKETKKEELLLDLIRKHYDKELQAKRDLDSKAGNLIGYVTIVTAIIVGLGTFSILGRLSEPRYYTPYFVGIAALLFSIIMSLFAIRIRKWASPVISDWEKYYRDEKMNYKHVMKQVFFPLAGAVSQNSTINQSKAKLISISWISLVVGIGSLTVYAGAVFLTGDTEQSEIKITVDGNSTMLREILKVIQTITNETTPSIE